MSVPSTPGAHTDPKSNETRSSITASNKSPQTPQAQSQNVPQGRANTGGAGVIAGAGSSARRIQNGSVGKPYGRKA